MDNPESAANEQELGNPSGSTPRGPADFRKVRSTARRVRMVEEPLHVLLVSSSPESPRIAAAREVLEQLPEPPDLEELDSFSRLDDPPGPELVLLEPDGFDVGGLETLEGLTTRHRAPLWVLLLPDAEEHFGRAGLTRGADDYLLSREIEPSTLERILRYAMRRRMTELDVHEATVRYGILFERSTDGIMVVDDEGVLRDVNPRLAEMFGYESTEILGENIEVLIPEGMPDAYTSFRLDDGKAPVPRPRGLEHLKARRRDGSVFPAEIGLAPLSFGGHDAVAVTVRDISAVEGRRRLADLVDASEDAILGASLDGTVESWNGGAARYFDKTPEEAIGHPLSSFLAPEVIEELPDILRRVRAGEHVRSIENFLIDETGRHVHLSLSLSPLADRTGAVTGVGVIGRDITHQKILEADLEEMAYQDPLTRVANRRFLRERLQYAISLARREQFAVGLVYLDLSKFKRINDRFGHATGDAVLVEVAGRLKAKARESDLVARFGGDEFVILLSQVEGETGAVEAARRFEGALEGPIRVGKDVEVSVGAQLGVALYPDHGTEADELFAAADRALYGRKEARWLADSPPGFEDSVGVAAIPSLEARLRAALDEAQLRLYGQPVARAADGELAGIEVLVRWSHPEAGILAAREFLPSAGELGMMPEIDYWVLSSLMTAIRDHGPQKAGTWFALNLSDQTLKNAETLSSLASLIEELGLSEGGLRVEIRESPSIMSPRLVAGMEYLGQCGAKIVIDNYGVGHSSLAQLSDIPADALKLDRTLVRQLDSSVDAVRLVHAAIGLGVAAGMQVGVEGVERAAQAEYLRGDGCSFLQGFYFGHPAPLEQILDSAWDRPT